MAYSHLIVPIVYVRWEECSENPRYTEFGYGFMLSSVKWICVYAFLDFRTQLTNKHFEQPHIGAVKLSPELYFVSAKCQNGRSQWPHGCTAARLLKLWVRIPPGTWMPISCECYVLKGRDLCDGPITRPELLSNVRCTAEITRLYILLREQPSLLQGMKSLVSQLASSALVHHSTSQRWILVLYHKVRVGRISCTERVYKRYVLLASELKMLVKSLATSV
jgi:hypothetical protein